MEEIEKEKRRRRKRRRRRRIKDEEGNVCLCNDAGECLPALKGHARVRGREVLIIFSSTPTKFTHRLIITCLLAYLY